MLPNSELTLIEARQRAAHQEQRELGAPITRLEALASALREARAPSVELLVTTVEAMMMYEKYYTQEQLEQLAERREALGAQEIAAAEASWRGVFAQLAELKVRGVEPTSPELEPLVAQARELFAMFTGGDAQLAASAAQLWQHEGDAMRGHGFAPEVFAYLRAAQGGAELRGQRARVARALALSRRRIVVRRGAEAVTTWLA